MIKKKDEIINEMANCLCSGGYLDNRITIHSLGQVLDMNLEAYHKAETLRKKCNCEVPTYNFKEDLTIHSNICRKCNKPTKICCEAYHQSELGDIVKELEDSDTLDDAIIFFKQKLTK